MKENSWFCLKHIYFVLILARVVARTVEFEGWFCSAGHPHHCLLLPNFDDSFRNSRSFVFLIANCGLFKTLLKKELDRS